MRNNAAFRRNELRTRGSPGQVSNLWAPIRLVCQGRPWNSLISKEGLELGSERCKKSKMAGRAHETGLLQPHTESYTRNRSRHLVHGISAGTRGKAKQFAVISSRRLAGFGQGLHPIPPASVMPTAPAYTYSPMANKLLSGLLCIPLSLALFIQQW